MSGKTLLKTCIGSVALIGILLTFMLHVGNDYVIEHTTSLGQGRPAELTDSLKTQNRAERLNSKSVEMAKFVPRGKIVRGAYDIEIIDVAITEYGIDVLVRAWYKTNEQIGFGDGTVDIEKFQIPLSTSGRNGHLTHLVVTDPNGDIAVDYTGLDDDGGTFTYTKNYRFDPEENLLRTIDAAIKAAPRKNSNDLIVRNKIGTTLLAAQPEADVATTAGDGLLRMINETTYSAARDATSAESVLADNVLGVRANRDTSTNFDVRRSQTSFDTSAIDAGDTVSSSTAMIFYNSGLNDNIDSGSIDLVTSTTVTDPTTVTADDYDVTGWATTTPSDSVTVAVFDNDSTGSPFSVNTDMINKGGVTTLGWMHSLDRNNTTPTGRNRIDFSSADDADSTLHPWLYVDYAATPAAADPIPQPIITF